MIKLYLFNSSEEVDKFLVEHAATGDTLIIEDKLVASSNDHIHKFAKKLDGDTLLNIPGITYGEDGLVPAWLNATSLTGEVAVNIEGFGKFTGEWMSSVNRFFVTDFKKYDQEVRIDSGVTLFIELPEFLERVFLLDADSVRYLFWADACKISWEFD